MIRNLYFAIEIMVMSDLREEIVKVYGNRVRVRVCGLCFEGEKVLLARHHSLGSRGIFWAPPGGGLEYGESSEDSLVREFREETGLEVCVKDFLFVHEFLSPPLHGIELFFEVVVKSGNLRLGHDPEMGRDKQILQELKYVPLEEIKRDDPSLFHHVLTLADTAAGLRKLRGYFKYDNSLPDSRIS